MRLQRPAFGPGASSLSASPVLRTCRGRDGVASTVAAVRTVPLGSFPDGAGWASLAYGPAAPVRNARAARPPLRSGPGSHPAH